MENKYYYYDINVQIWEDPDGLVYYSVIQSFDEDGDDEVLAYGSVEDAGDAIKRAREAVTAALE